MSILHIVGTRPNFVKTASVIHAFNKKRIPQWLIHTGQHYDHALSGSFFNELGLPPADVNLNIKNSVPFSTFISEIYHGIMVFCQSHSPNIAIVYGDVNATLAAALACKRLKIPIAHVEAGLRSFDDSMQEEINRIMIDHLSSFLFTTEPSANINLLKEGIENDKIFFVGNCMIDTLKKMLPLAVSKTAENIFGLHTGKYLLCTFHRPFNIDNITQFYFIQKLLSQVSCILPIIFPIHPRTKMKLEATGILYPKNVLLTAPLPYLTFTA